MKSKKLKFIAAATAAVMVIGGAGVLAACDPGDGESGEVYKRVETDLTAMEDCPFNIMTSGLDDSEGIMPYDSWGDSKFTTVKHTLTLQIGTVGFADEEDVDIHIQMKSDGTVDFATGDSKTALESKNLANGTISSGFGPNATTSSVADTIHSLNYMFKLETYLKGNGVSDGYTGEGYACYVWYGKVGDMLVGEDDGLEAGEKAYSIPVSTYSEYYVTGDLSHGGSTTSIVPDAGFYINSLMNQSEEPYKYAAHVGGTDPNLVYVTPKVLGMAYFKSAVVYIDTSTKKITRFDPSYYSAPVTSTNLDLYNGTEKLGSSSDASIAITMTVNETLELTVDAGSSLISSLVVLNSADEYDTENSVTTTFSNSALTVTAGNTNTPASGKQIFTLTAVEATESPVTVIISKDRGATMVAITLSVTITAAAE